LSEGPTVRSENATVLLCPPDFTFILILSVRPLISIRYLLFHASTTNTSYVSRPVVIAVVKLMENSDFNTVPLGSAASIEELDRKTQRSQYRGAVLLLVWFVYIPIQQLFPREIAEFLLIPGMIICMMASFVGMVFLAIASTWNAYTYGVEVLQRISPPNPVVTEGYVVVKIKNTFIFILRSAPYNLYFASFLHSESIPASEIDVPRNFWNWDSVLHIEGLRVHVRRGIFSIPAPEREILSGKGILLALPIRGRFHMLHVPEFSRDRLLAVAEYASSLPSEEASFD
jgi:hypothetical protein